MAQPNFVFTMTDTQGANVVGCCNTGQPPANRVES